MKFVIQRVSHGEVSAEGKLLGTIEKGFVVLIGICDTDTEAVADKMIQKMLNMRIFTDENGKTNLSLQEVGGEILLISQFTLYADCKKGNRPSFTKAGNPEYANKMYQHIIAKCTGAGYHTECGEFGADMKVALINDGPFTIVLDSEDIC